jgi:hypothetical protein
MRGRDRGTGGSGGGGARRGKRRNRQGIHPETMALELTKHCLAISQRNNLESLNKGWSCGSAAANGSNCPPPHVHDCQPPFPSFFPACARTQARRATLPTARGAPWARPTRARRVQTASTSAMGCARSHPKVGQCAGGGGGLEGSSQGSRRFAPGLHGAGGLLEPLRAR